MNKVYIVTAGEYSDYHIVGATLDRAKAELARQAYERGYARFQPESVSIEEYDLDAFDTIREKDNIYHVNFSPDSGPEIFEPMCDDSLSFNKCHVFINELEVEVAAKDESHALKIAQDLRAQYLAEKEGIS